MKLEDIIALKKARLTRLESSDKCTFNVARKLATEIRNDEKKLLTSK